MKYTDQRELPATFNADVDKKVSLGLLDEEQGNKMKEELSAR